jgi:hypothetical protein
MGGKQRRLARVGCADDCHEADPAERSHCRKIRESKREPRPR